MRLHCMSLLVAAALLAMVDGSVTTITEVSTTRSINTNSIPTPRLLRSEDTVTEGDEERMITASSIVNFFKRGTSSKVTSKIPASVASNVAKDTPGEAMLKAGVPIKDSFKNFGLDEADDLLGHSNFMEWFNYVTRFNQKYADEATTVVEFLNSYYKDKNKVSEILATSMKSNNKNVQKLASGLQIGQMDIWLKKNKYTPEQLAKYLGVTIHAPVVKMYTQHYIAAMEKAAKKAAKKAAAAAS